MASAFTSEDLMLLGYDEIRDVELGSQAIGFIAKTKAGIEQAEHVFVYFKTDATREDIIKAAKRIDGKRPTYVLRGKSGPTDSLLKSAFSTGIKIFQIEELLWARVSELFRAYATNISTSIPEEPHFIAPRGEELETKERLDAFLVDYFTKAPAKESRKQFVVLKANAGVGKTTFCRQFVKELARRLATYKTIPVYVEAAHWGGRVTNVSGLWDIIQLSLQSYDSSSGISKNLFEAALRRGLILFVLDGFDELCSSPKSNISALEVIEDLLALAEDSDARILLTTRTPYWKAEVGEDPEQVHSLNLLPFNSQQAKEYIRLFFGKDTNKFESARQLYGEVTAHAVNPDNPGGAREQFWNLPIAVSIVCEAVKAGVSREDWASFSLDDLLVAICERETKRQNLGISGLKQLLAFTELALLDASKAVTVFDREDLVAAGVPESDASKFISHPLLRFVDDKNYSFTYDFFGPFLRASEIRGAIISSDPIIRSSILDAMKAEENGKGFQIEHAARLLERCDLEKTFEFLKRVPAGEQGAKSFLVHLLLRQADTSADSVSAKDRGSLLIRALGDSIGAIRDARFTGAYERLDLSSQEFVNCEFRDVSFKGVHFHGARFRSCRFDGEIQFLTKSDEELFTKAVLIDCEIRSSARLALEPLLSRDPSEQSDLIKDLLEAGLSKFWHNGRFRATIRKGDWKKGALGRSRSSNALLEVLRRAKLIQEAEISGVHEGGWVFNREAINDLQHFMDHRQLSGQVLKAFEELRRTLGSGE
jgi:uncharacterized protein YjbI with pentapeptide repeats